MHETEMEKMMNNCLYNSPIGILRIGEDSGRITSLYLHQKENDSTYDNSISQMQQNKQNRQHQQEQRSELLTEACRQLDEYFQGKRRNFDLPIGYAGTPFQKKVWRELQSIPYGETRSYEDIAVKIGSPRAVRAVGQANNRNPILLIIPCHRVIHKNGDISGFACGIAAKKYLLDLEKNFKNNTRQERGKMLK